MSQPSPYVFNPPPNWPPVPPGWTPPAGWQPDPAWGPAPEGWNFWTLPQADQPPWAPPPSNASDSGAAPLPQQPRPALGTFLPPQPAETGNWFARHKILSGVGAAFLFLVLVSAASGGGADEPQRADVDLAASGADAAESDGAADKAAADKAAADKAAADKAAADKAAADKAAADKAAADKAAADKAAAEADKKGPADQQAFLKAVVVGRQGYESTDNELKQRQIQKQRDAAVCAAVPGRTIANWSGKIKSLDTNGEGKAVLELEIGDGTKVATWNNAFSDTFDNTLIPMDSPMYAALIDMEKGDDVRFSGTFLDDTDTCLAEHSMTLHGQMKTPNFVFRFSDVKAV